MTKFSRWAAICCILLGLPLLTGMGGAPSDIATDIPRPQENHRVALTDQGGTRVELTGFALAGRTCVCGRLGKGQASVPFTRIKSLKLLRDGQGFTCLIRLTDGGRVSLMADPGQEASGSAAFGNYAIAMKEVTSIEFFGPTAHGTD